MPAKKAIGASSTTWKNVELRQRRRRQPAGLRPEALGRAVKDRKSGDRETRRTERELEIERRLKTPVLLALREHAA